MKQADQTENLNILSAHIKIQTENMKSELIICLLKVSDLLLIEFSAVAHLAEGQFL